MSRPRRLVLGLVPLLALLLAGELTLAALGLGARPNDLSRGFDPGAAYLVPDADVVGGWRTVYRTGDQLAIPPRGEALRVVLLGGSSVAWLPDWLLPPLLDEARPDRAHEVLNLGREGYGSERLLHLGRQALERLEPDVLVVYSGHNEFVERGFALELDQSYGGALLRRAAQTASHLRLFNLLAGSLADGEPVPAEDALDVDPAAGTLDRQSLPEALRYWQAFAENLGSLCDAAAARDVPVLLCTPVSNLLAPPFAFDEATVLEPAAAEAHRELRNRAVQRIPEPLRRGLAPVSRLHPADWLLGELSQPYAPPAPRSFDGLLGETGATEGRHFTSVAGAHWPDPTHWSRAARELVGTQGRLLARQLDDGQRQRLAGARAILEKALGAVPDDPFAHYLLGLVLWLLGGDDAAAVQHLAVAGSYDRAPRSANPTCQALLRQLAAERPHVTLLDTAQRFAQRVPAGLTSYELFMDHCHLHPGARGVLVADLAEALTGLLEERGR